MRVLLGRAGLRGDLAINLPAISYLHQRFGWEITMPIHRRFADMAPLFLNHPDLAGVIITDAYDGFPSARDQEVLVPRRFDRVYDPMTPHFTDRWFKTCHQTECVLVDYMALRMLPEQRQIKLARWFETPRYEKYHVAFAPFAGYEHNPANTKQLSIERAQEVVNHLRERGYWVVQLGGPNEPRLRDTIVHTGDYFVGVKAMLACKALIATDTGLGWFASGYQHPTLGLYGTAYHGAAHIEAIQPVNPRARYLSAETVAAIPLDSIKAEIDLLLSS